VHVIIWEYRVKTEHLTVFEDMYSAGGLWAELFGKANGYSGTELLRDPGDPRRYITIDRWVSWQDHESFLLHWKTEYAALDARCEQLTEKESLFGEWDSISQETR
jgi:heme-degrading monooxygenase HmoA